MKSLLLQIFTNREIISKRITRMWFSKEKIYTIALDILVVSNRTNLEKEIEEFIIEQFHTLDVEELYYTINNLFEELNKSIIRVSKTYIKKIIKESFKLEEKNSCYKLFKIELTNSKDGKCVYHDMKKEKYYTFIKTDFMKSC